MKGRQEAPTGDAVCLISEGKAGFALSGLECYAFRLSVAWPLPSPSGP